MPKMTKSNNFKIYNAGQQKKGGKIRAKKSFFGKILLNFYTSST